MKYSALLFNSQQRTPTNRHIEMEITSRNIYKLKKCIGEKEGIIEDYAKTIQRVKDDNINLVLENKKLLGNNRGLSKRSRSNKTQRNLAICVVIGLGVSLILNNQ